MFREWLEKRRLREFHMQQANNMNDDFRAMVAQAQQLFTPDDDPKV